MRHPLRVALVAGLTAAGTAFGGWWSVPLVAALWVRVLPSDRRPLFTTMLGAAAGWLALLGIAAFQGPIPAVAGVVSGVLGLPRWGFLLATLLYPALLAAAAAILTRPAQRS